MAYIKHFRELSRHDASIAGGKGASLGEMENAGFPIPPGFVILAQTFEEILRHNSLNQKISTILKTVDHNQMDQVNAASSTIQKLILNASIPNQIEKQILSHFTKLNTQYVAVRSSATSEDSSEAAWAGQLNSYLNTTRHNLIENIKNCWASLFTPRAIFYRFEKSLHTQQISVAVVVQKMVHSDVSGIAFSVHPVTNNPKQMIIEACFGLGEAIVSGQVTPDSYIVDKEEDLILDIAIGEQTKGLYRHPEKGNHWKEITNTQVQKISGKRIMELATIIKQIESHYGFPCDIEWAFENSQFYITQSRPITTLQKEGLY